MNPFRTTIIFTQMKNNKNSDPFNCYHNSGVCPWAERLMSQNWGEQFHQNFMLCYRTGGAHLENLWQEKVAWPFCMGFDHASNPVLTIHDLWVGYITEILYWYSMNGRVQWFESFNNWKWWRIFVELTCQWIRESSYHYQADRSLHQQF